MGKLRTITLSNRPPVRIDEDNWPLIASASDDEHDGQVECQANRISEWSIRVRQHEDGRAIVYATYSYSTNWQHERGYQVRHGDLLAADATTETIVAAIQSVCERMGEAECDGDDASRWSQLADDCIADMPAEDLDTATGEAVDHA